MVEQIKIEDIKPYPKNAKKHPKKQIEQIAASIKEFGFNQPIVVDKDGVIIVGHGRYEAAKLLDIEPEIKIVDIPKKKANAYRLADNKLNESDWDMELVLDELKELESDELVELTGFDKDLLIEPDEKDDIIPENVPAKAKLGDIYQLGEHRVMCGDSTKGEDVEKLMDGKKADMVFTDPPYGIGYEYNSHKDVKGQEYLDFCEKWFNIVSKYSELKVIFTGWKYNKFWFNNEPYDVFYWIVKNKHSGGKNSNFRNTEPIFIWGKFKKKFHFDYIFVDSIQRLTGPADIHSCPKPVQLLSDFIIRTDYKGLILDVFLGSGSTLIACEKTNRKCYGMEIDPHYCDVIVKRWEDYTGQKAQKVV